MYTEMVANDLDKAQQHALFKAHEHKVAVSIEKQG